MYDKLILNGYKITQRLLFHTLSGIINPTHTTPTEHLLSRFFNSKRINHPELNPNGLLKNNKMKNNFLI